MLISGTCAGRDWMAYSSHAQRTLYGAAGSHAHRVRSLTAVTERK
jgi:hypothetical protein